MDKHDCHSFVFKMCDEVAAIIFEEQSKLLKQGKFRGRQQIIDRIIKEWDHSKRERNDAGTDALETGNI
jgi:hypothetical protein